LKSSPYFCDIYSMGINIQPIKQGLQKKVLLKIPSRRVKAFTALSLFKNSRLTIPELAQNMLENCIRGGELLRGISSIYLDHFKKFRLDPGEKGTINFAFHDELNRKNDHASVKAAYELFEMIRLLP